MPKVFHKPVIDRHVLVFLHSGDTCSASLQNTDSVSEQHQELDQGETGRLTEADRARTGRVGTELPECSNKHKTMS